MGFGEAFSQRLTEKNHCEQYHLQFKNILKCCIFSLMIDYNNTDMWQKDLTTRETARFKNRKYHVQIEKTHRFELWVRL